MNWKIGRILAAGQRLAPEDWHCGGHRGIYRLFYIHSGKGGYFQGEIYHEFQPDTLYLLPGSVEYRPVSSREDPLLHSYAVFELIPPVSSQRILWADPHANDLRDAAVRTLCAIGKRCTDRAPRCCDIHEGDPLHTLLSGSILTLTAEIAAEKKLSPIQDEVILDALRLIHEQTGAPLSTKDLAKQCYLHPDSLIRRFRKVMGVPPYAYQKELRLRRAASLREEGLSYRQIAKEVGYSDESALLHAQGAKKREP